MKSNGLFLAALLTAGVLLAGSQTGTQSQAASPGNDQGTSAYGNSTSSSGALHQPPASTPRLLLAVFQQGVTTGQSTSGQNSASQQSPSANSMGSTATPQPPSPDAGSNAALQSRINDALRNEPTLGASHVVSNVSDTGIDLSGTVGSTKDKQTAERIASSFDGNRKLTDNIVVTGAGHSDLAPNHPALNNSWVGNAQNPVTSNPPKQK